MNKKVLALGLSVALTTAVFTGCTKKDPAPVDENKPVVNVSTGEEKGDLVDGTYLIKNEVSDHGNYSMAKLEVKDGQVAALDYNEYLVDSGDAKNESNYPYAEGIAVIKDLNAQFNDKKDLDAVDFDAVSGATSTKGTFKEMTGQLLDMAAKGETYAPVYKDGVYEAKATEASHGWLSEVKIKIQDGQIVGVDYAEIAVEDADGVKTGDRKSPDNYAFETTFEVAKAMKKLIIDNNGTENIDVDSVTGATSTRDTIVELVNQALSSAK